MYSGSLRGNGDETQESWKPLLNTIPAIRGLNGMVSATECVGNILDSSGRPIRTYYFYISKSLTSSSAQSKASV